MLTALSFSFTNLTASNPIPPAQQQQCAATLEEDAEVMSNTALGERITASRPRWRRRS